MNSGTNVQEARVQDEFNRLPAVEVIIKLLSSNVKVSPLVVDGDWGLERRCFVKNWSSLPGWMGVHLDQFILMHLKLIMRISL